MLQYKNLSARDAMFRFSWRHEYILLFMFDPNSQYNLLMNAVGIFDCTWSSLNQEWEPHNSFFLALDKIAYNSNIN